ncbi:MAG: hypothetical protein D6814_02890 [Calditrichaeota bacterium]|nr:MAG: hypothetical protein D6814_02890 [Calditrichota bacterium]
MFKRIRADKTKKGFILNSSPKTLHLPLNTGPYKKAFKEFRMEAENEKFFMFSGGVSIGSYHFRCGILANLVFEERNMHEVSYSAK